MPIPFSLVFIAKIFAKKKYNFYDRNDTMVSQSWNHCKVSVSFVTNWTSQRSGPGGGSSGGHSATSAVGYYSTRWRRRMRPGQKPGADAATRRKGAGGAAQRSGRDAATPGRAMRPWPRRGRAQPIATAQLALREAPRHASITRRHFIPISTPRGGISDPAATVITPSLVDGV